MQDMVAQADRGGPGEINCGDHEFYRITVMETKGNFLKDRPSEDGTKETIIWVIVWTACRNWIGVYLGWYLTIGSLVARLNSCKSFLCSKINKLTNS